MRLAELQRVMHDLLRGRADIDRAAETLGADPRRLAIYREMVASHIARVLDKDFGRLRRLAGADTWQRWSTDYYRERPCEHWELNQAGAGFADWLEDAGTDPFLVAMARFEWEEFSTYMHRAIIPAAVEAPTLNPTVAVLAAPWDLAGFLAAHRKADLSPETPRPPPLAEPAPLFLFRSPTTARVVRLAGDAAALFAFKVAADGLDEHAAAAESGLPVDRVRALLGAAADRGLILLPAG